MEIFIFILKQVKSLMSINAPNPEFVYFLSFLHDSMLDEIICVLVRIKVRGHLVMSIIQFLPISKACISGHKVTTFFFSEICLIQQRERRRP